MEKYSKVWTQFETQSMAFVKLRMALYPEYLVRGYPMQIVIYKPTVDQNNPVKLLTIQVRSSSNKDEVGLFPKGDKEVLLIGGDAAWQVADLIKPYL